MIKRISLVLSLMGVVLASGCDTTQPTDISESVGDVAWRPDGSGMVALVEKVSQSAANVNPYQTFDLYNVDASGNIGNQITTSGQAGLGYFPAIFLSQDGTNAIVQLGTNIARVRVATGSSTDLIQSDNLLAVSPDSKYLLATDDQTGAISKHCSVYDISVTPPRRVSQFYAVSMFNGRGLWLDNGRFALTHNDSIGFNVKIYDTTGTEQAVFPNAEVPFHASAFASHARALFVRTDNETIDRIDLSTGQRTAVTGTPVLSMDVTPDARLMVYTAADSVGLHTMYEMNLTNGHVSRLVHDPVAVFLSPMGNQSAYINIVDAYNSNVQVTNVSAPQ